MFDRLQSVALRVAVVCAMAVSLMLAPPGASTSHDPVALAKAEAERHLQLAADIAEHGHSHDDGSASETHAGHLHGHNAADHLHDTPSQPPAMAALLAAPGQGWSAGERYTSLPLRVFELDRPPRA